MIPNPVAVTIEVILTAGVIALLIFSGLELARILRKAPGYLDAANLNRLADAMVVVCGVALLAWMVSSKFAGWMWLDYLFAGLVVLAVILSIITTTLINRALDRSETVEGQRS